MNRLTICILASLSFAGSIQAAQQVTPDNYARAEVDLSYQNIVKDVGSNKFRHDRQLIALDKQPAVTMNRDTVYSFGIFYAPKGTTVSLPKSKDDRYQSAMIMQNDDFTDQVFYGAGTYEIKSKTDFVAIVVRTQVNPGDPKDIDYVHQLQDEINVQWPAGTKVKAYKKVDWDQKSLKALRSQYQKEAAKLPNLNDTSGARGQVHPDKLRLGASVALGLLPPADAVYLYRDYGLKGDQCYKATYNKPDFKNGGFFSFTMYGADKYLHSENSNLNNRAIKFDTDGKFTIFYGPKERCGKVDNWLPTPGDNWYLGMRIYRPGESVINGTYSIPEPIAVK